MPLVYINRKTAVSHVRPDSQRGRKYSGPPDKFHTYASIVGIAYFPVFVSIAPFVLGSFTSIMKLLGIPVLFLILGTDSKFLSC